VLGAVFATVVWGTAVYGLYTYLGTWLRGGDGPSAVPAAAALVVYGVGAALGSNVGGRLSDRFGARRVATSSLVGLAIPLAVIGLLLPGGAALIGALGIYGLVAYAFFPAHQTRLAKEFPERSATFLAWNNSALYAGITFGSVLGGVVMSSAGFGALAYACAAVALVGSALSARRTLPGRARARDETNAAQRS
jgi:predicted MFS family arabinose efflux permease